MQEKSKPVDNLRADAEKIITRAIAAVLPDAAVERALKGKTFLGRVYLVAAGKAAWQMAHAARACLQDNFCGGVVVTKYGHVKGEIANVACFEGGHPVPDENSLRGTDAALALTEDLTESGTVVFLALGRRAARFLKSRCFRLRNCRTSRISSLPRARTSWRSTRSASGFPPSRADASPGTARRRRSSLSC